MVTPFLFCWLSGKPANHTYGYPLLPISGFLAQQGLYYHQIPFQRSQRAYPGQEAHRQIGEMRTSLGKDRTLYARLIFSKPGGGRGA